MHRRLLAGILAGLVSGLCDVEVAAARVGQGQQPAQIPLTLESALRTLTASLGSDGATPGLAVALSARPMLLPALQTSASSLPQTGMPVQRTLTQQISVDIGSHAARLGRARAAQAAGFQALASLASSRRGAMQNLLAAFYAVAADQIQIASASQSVALGRRTLAATAERRRVGVAPRLDEDRARASLRTSEADLAALTAALDADRAALEFLLSGQAVESVALPATSSLPDAVVVLARAIQYSPTVATASAALAEAKASTLLVDAQSRPSLSLGAGASITRAGIDQSVGPALYAGLTVPVSSGIVRAERGAAQARVVAARRGLDQAQNEASQTALRLRAQAVAAAARLAPLTDAVANAQRVVDSTLAGYRLGAIGGADLITAQIQLVAARSALDAATLQASQAYATLQIEIGELPS